MLRILPRIVPANWTDDAQRARWPDVPLTVLMLALPLIGLIAIYSASIAVSYAETGDPHYYFRRQILFLIVGLAAAFTMMRIDYHWFSRIQFLGINLTFWLLAATVAVLLLMAVTDIGYVARGSARWIRWGSVSLQPSELAKPIIILYLAQVLAKREEGVNKLVQLLDAHTDYWACCGNCRSATGPRYGNHDTAHWRFNSCSGTHTDPFSARLDCRGIACRLVCHRAGTVSITAAQSLC